MTRYITFYRLSPEETWKVGYQFTAGTPQLATTHYRTLLLLLLESAGCPDAQVRVSSTLL